MGTNNERGSITTFVALMVIPVVLMAALAFDGGVILAERRAALDAAQNAALAGTQAVDPAAARTGDPVLSPVGVEVAAREYLERIGYNGTVTSSPPGNPTEVVVVVTSEVELRLLSIAGIGPKTVSATASSRLSIGVENAGP